MRLDLDPWRREQYFVVCNIAKWTILCIVVHFQPVIKLLQKGVRVHHRRAILMQKMQNFSGDPSPVGTPPPHTSPHRRLDLNPPPIDMTAIWIRRPPYSRESPKLIITIWRHTWATHSYWRILRQGLFMIALGNVTYFINKWRYLENSTR